MGNEKQVKDGIKLIQEYVKTRSNADKLKNKSSDKDRAKWQTLTDRMVVLSNKIQTLPSSVKKEIKAQGKNGPFQF